MKLLYFIILIIIQGVLTTFNHPKEIQIPEPLEDLTTEIDSINDYALCGKYLFTSGKRGLLFSEDKGETWKRQKNFPAVRAVSITSNENELFVLTDYEGLYYSDNCGNSWESIKKDFEIIDEAMGIYCEPQKRKILEIKEY
jgi:hypothetical protein